MKKLLLISSLFVLAISTESFALGHKFKKTKGNQNRATQNRVLFNAVNFKKMCKDNEGTYSNGGNTLAYCFFQANSNTPPIKAPCEIDGGNLLAPKHLSNGRLQMTCKKR